MIVGVSVTFFVRTSEELEDNILSVFANSSESEEDKADNDEVPWHQPYTSDDDSVDDTFSRRSFSPTNQSRSHPKKYVWVSTCVCLLFRSPYFQQISRCLELAFQASILPQLQRWEENRTQMIRNYGMMSDSALLPSYFYMSQQMQLWRQFPACHLTMENLFATLCLEHPLPILNLLSLTLELPLGESAESNDEKERIKFEAYDAQSLPKLSYSLAHVLQLFGARGMIDILCCVLSESRMMFHSADVSKLTIICEGFRSLIYPFTWTHVYLPVVPVQLMNLVEAPVPYMLGTHSENMRQIQPQYLQEMVTINCDTGSIQKNGVTILQFPEKEDRWLVTALTHLSLPSALHEDGRALRAPIDRLQHQAFTPTEKPIATDTISHMSKVSMDLKIQIMIFDVLVQFLRYIPDCLFYLNPNCPVFNRPLFMTEYASEEYRDMLEILTVTNAFHTVTESMNSPHLTFFADCIQRITEAETKLISQMTDQNFNVKSPEYFTRPFGDIPEPDEDEGMTNNLTTASSHSLRTPRMQSFSRSLSVANIIYDKIGNSATKDASSVSSNTSYSLQRAFSFRNPSSAIKKTPSEGSGVSSPSNNHRMHQSKSSISLLKSASLFNMDISSPNRNPVQQQKYTVHMLNDRLYDSFLPNWVLRKSEICAPTAAVSPRADFKVTLTINTKFGQEEEVEAYGISALVEHRLQLYIPFLESNTDKSMELVLPIQYTCVNDIDYSIEPNQPSNVEGEENESAKSSSTINFSPGKPLASPQVDPRSEHSDSGRKSKMVAEEDCPLLYFNRDYVVQAQKSVKHWDIAALSEYFHISESEMTVLFRENPHSLMYDSSTPHHVVGNSTSPSTQRPIATSANCNRLNQRNILSRAMSSQQNTHTFNKLTGSTGHHGHMVTVDEAITDFLQKIMVYTNLDANYIDTAMEKCLYAFQMQENRTGFLTILKQAKKQQEDSKSSSAGNHMMANIYPLHDSTFDAFSQLFDGMLSICSQHEDFITAFELLEVGGHYFRILPEQLQRLEQLLQQSTAVPDEEFEEDIIEFLSEKACHHPIYQMPNFWKALMHHRLPISTLKTNEHLKVYAASSTVRSGGKLNKVGVNLVMTEVRSILYMMLGMGVNSSRALSFIQAIATDYYLALDDYFKLQRFSTRLWAQHEGENLPLKTPSSDRISPGNIISSHTAANLQSQTSAASISNMPSGSRKVSRMSSGFREGRRNSINIGDLMTRQGHGEKLSTVKSKEDGMDSATIFYTNTNDSADNVILSNGSFELLSSMTPSTTGTGGGIFSPSTFRGLSTMFSPSLDPIHTESNSEQSFGDSLTPPRSPYIHQNSGPVVTPRNKTQGFIFDEPLALDSANLSRASSIVRTNINEGNEHVNHRHNSIDNGSLSRMRQQIVNVENLEEDRSNSGKHSYPDDTYYDSMLDAGLDNTLFEAKDIKVGRLQVMFHIVNIDKLIACLGIGARIESINYGYKV